MARLILTFKDRTLLELPIEAEEISIGRDQANAMHIDSLAVAPRHAVVRARDEGLVLWALDAAYPVMVNGKPVSEHVLTDRDRIAVGKHEIVFRDEDAQFESAQNDFKPPAHMPEASLQVLKGKSIGLMIPLRGGMTRLGKDESGSAVIAKRKDGYFLSALSATQLVQVNDGAVGEKTVQLNSGDVIRISEHVFKFFCE